MVSKVSLDSQTLHMLRWLGNMTLLVNTKIGTKKRSSGNLGIEFGYLNKYHKQNPESL